jgi:hypothetical protein
LVVWRLSARLALAVLVRVSLSLARRTWVKASQSESNC